MHSVHARRERLDDGGPSVPPSSWGLCAALLAAALGLLGALAALARSTVALTGLALPVGLAGVGGLLAVLLRSLLLRSLLLAALLRGLLLASALLRGLLLGRLLLATTLLRGLLQATTEGVVARFQTGIGLGQPGLSLAGVARGDVAVERAVELLQLAAAWRGTKPRRSLDHCTVCASVTVTPWAWPTSTMAGA